MQFIEIFLAVQFVFDVAIHAFELISAFQKCLQGVEQAALQSLKRFLHESLNHMCIVQDPKTGKRDNYIDGLHMKLDGFRENICYIYPYSVH